MNRYYQYGEMKLRWRSQQQQRQRQRYTDDDNNRRDDDVYTYARTGVIAVEIMMHAKNDRDYVEIRLSIKFLMLVFFSQWDEMCYKRNGYTQDQLTALFECRAKVYITVLYSHF